MFALGRFSELIDANPALPLKRGQEVDFIAMEELTPGTRYVHSKRKRAFLGSGAKFTSGDTLFARITPSLENGKIAQAFIEGTAGFGSTEFFVLRAKQNVADPAFVFYLATTPSVRGPAEKSMSGASGRQRADIDAVLSAEVPSPSLSEQKAIAEILSAFDDLIENNMRRIAILEEMAKRLYEAWFVHFRFPDHEEAEFEEGEIGMTPADWTVVPLEEVVLVNPKTTVPREGFKPFVPMGSLSETNMTIGPIEEREGNSGTKFQNGDTLVARITPCLENGKTGFVNFLDEEQPVAFGSTEYIVLRPLILGQHAIYCLARSHAFRDVAIKSMSGSEGRQRVRPESVKSFPIAKPPADLLERFEQIAEPMFTQVSAFARTNTNLRAQRDLLLPKLVSGEIDVSEAQEAMEAAE